MIHAFCLFGIERKTLLILYVFTGLLNMRGSDIPFNPGEINLVIEFNI